MDCGKQAERRMVVLQFVPRQAGRITNYHRRLREHGGPEVDQCLEPGSQLYKQVCN